MKVIRGMVVNDDGSPLPSQNLTKEEAQSVLSILGSAAFPFAVGVPLGLNEAYEGIKNRNPVQSLLGGAGAVLGSLPYVNTVGRVAARPFATPYFNTETAVTNPELLQNIGLGNKAGMAASAERLNTARNSAGGQFAKGDIPAGQGAWWSEAKNAPEFNPVYSQAFPRSFKRVENMKEPMRYAAQTSENLTQEGNAVMRFIPQVIKDTESANALMLKNILPSDIKKLGSKKFLDNYAVAARPNNQAMIIPLDSSQIGVTGLLSDVKKAVPKTKIKTGYSNEGIDRVYMDRSGKYGKPYTEFGATPRPSSPSQLHQNDFVLLDELDRLFGQQKY